jgi:SAM-dependent methyltransferase
MPPADPRRHAPATARNREAILAALRDILPQRGLVLEIAAGTGEHAAFMAPRLGAELIWQPSDADPAALAGIDAHARDSGAGTIRPAIRLDVTDPAWPITSAAAVFAANLVHIAPWRAAMGLFAGAGRLLEPDGVLVLYGPFKRDGRHTAASNEAFDRSLRRSDPGWGVRCLEGELDPLAAAAGLDRDQVVPMPANNLVVVWCKRGLRGRDGMGPRPPADGAAGSPR